MRDYILDAGWGKMMRWGAPSHPLEWRAGYPHPTRRVGISLLAKSAKPLRAPTVAYGVGIAAVPPCIYFQLAVHKVAPRLPSSNKKRFDSLPKADSFGNVVTYILLNMDSARSKNCDNTTSLLSPLANIVAKAIILLTKGMSTLVSSGRIGVWQKMSDAVSIAVFLEGYAHKLTQKRLFIKPQGFTENQGRSGVTLGGQTKKTYPQTQYALGVQPIYGEPLSLRLRKLAKAEGIPRISAHWLLLKNLVIASLGICGLNTVAHSNILRNLRCNN